MTENPWIPYDGEREKEFYDIKLKNGEVIECCWPNSYYWNTVLISPSKVYKDEEVEAIRTCQHPLERKK